MRLLTAAVFGAALVLATPALAGGPFGIDHPIAVDKSGPWKRSTQLVLLDATALAALGGALFVPHDSRLGRTFGQSLDATVFATGTSVGMKYIFDRARPDESSDPNDFFAGSGHHSFPSGEVAAISAAVTPFIAEYHGDHPVVWGLALLPAYDAVARVKNGEHWQSDVVAGAAIGVLWGRWAHARKSPVLIGLLPDGSVGLEYAKALR
jgi:membrane-associated phospholipid phosphatase